MFTYSEFNQKKEDLTNNYIEQLSTDYRIYIMGKEIPVYTCWISAYPFNTWWPGHQRYIDQTEVASYINLIGDEELIIEVVPKNAYKRIMVKPYSKGINAKIEGGNIKFNIKENGHYVLELDSYHHCLYIFYSKPITCNDKNSVTHYFGAGIHVPGKITLKSGDKVYIDKDALVYGHIYAENAENIEIYGNGIFDDENEKRVTGSCLINGNIKFVRCKNIKMKGIGFKNSACWCVNIFNCFDVEIDTIKVFGQWRYNTDGIDIVNSQDIVIKNSFVHSFDDTVVIKGLDDYAETDNINILIENCVLWCDWGRCCELGFETACREYKNIIFRDIDILRAGAVALSVHNGDYAEIHDILYENINVEYNDSDTQEVLQQSDDHTYNAHNTIAIPYIFEVNNYRFREIYKDFVQDFSPDALNGINKIAYCHHITARNIRVYYDKGIPLHDGKYNVPISAREVVEGVGFHNLIIENLSVNEERITEETAIKLDNQSYKIKII